MMAVGDSMPRPAAFAPEALSADDCRIFSFRQNILVGASAGTGKTHRLTALYVLLTLGLTSRGCASDAIAAPPLSPRNIVATTFSRAAALEMRTRIHHALVQIEQWDGESDVVFGPILRARLEALAEPPSVSTIRKRAALALAEFGAARVDTLHGLALSILERATPAIGAATALRVMEEEEARLLFQRALNETFEASLSAGGDMARFAREFSTACGGIGGLSQRLGRLVERLDEEGIEARELVLVDHAAHGASVERRLRQVARACATEASPALLEHSQRLLALISNETPPYCFQTQRALVEWMTLRKAHKSKRLPADEHWAEFRDEFSGTTHAERAQKLVALLQHSGSLREREVHYESFIERLQVRLRDLKERAHAASFSDILRLARNLLRDERETRLRVGESVEALLVDEFQDTSSVQRDIVYLLREAPEHTRLRPPGTAPLASALLNHGLFIVGDRKQSIYGFRGADVTVFSRVCIDIAGAEGMRALGLQTDARASNSELREPVGSFVALRESRRSAPAILDFVNAFSAFDFHTEAKSAEGISEFAVSYSDSDVLVAAASKASDIGTVTLVDDDGTLPEGAPALLRGASGSLREAMVASAYIARRVRSPDAAEPALRFRDIAVLTRRRRTIPLIEFALERLAVPYVVAGRALYATREVRDLAALLRLIVDPRDRLALATVLRGPLVMLSDTALLVLSSPSKGLDVSLLGRDPRALSNLRASGPVAAIGAEERERLQAFRTRFRAVRPAMLRLSGAEAVRHAIAAFGLDEALSSQPRAAITLGNLDRVVELARKVPATLFGFVRTLEGRIEEETDETEAAVFSEDDDAVRITTIHASKGLDFTAVVLVDLNAEPRPEPISLGMLPKTGDRKETLVVRHYGTAFDVAHEKMDPRFRPLTSIPTTAMQMAAALATERDRAERQRLTYVALTRAKRELTLVGTPARPRPGSAWMTLTACRGHDSLRSAITRVQSAPSLLGEPWANGAAVDLKTDETPLSRQARELPIPTADLPPGRAPRELSMATTPLSMFATCARRFQLRHLLGVEEPAPRPQLSLFDVPSDSLVSDDRSDPRAQGRAAHRVLERAPHPWWGTTVPAALLEAALVREGLPQSSPELSRLSASLQRFLSGPYAVSLRSEGAHLRREESFTLPIRVGDGSVLVLRGTIDLLVAYPDGRIDVLDYKRSRKTEDLSTYDFQLRAYALHAERAFLPTSVRAGVLFLGAAEPSFLKNALGTPIVTAEDASAFENALQGHATTLCDSFHTRRFEGVATDQCRRLHCGFIKACHGESA